MQDTKPDKPTESKSSPENDPPLRMEYKLVFGFLNTIEDFNTIDDDPVHKEVVRVVTQLCERLRQDYPDRGILLDVTECIVEGKKAYIV
jgi:hypothetical protein